MAKNGNSFNKGESGNPAGRPKGATNKATTDLRTWINTLINKKLPKIEKDLDALDSKDRLQIIEKLIQYCIPKQQSINVEAQIQAEYEAIEKLIERLPEKAIEEITNRLIRLNKLNTKQ